MDYYFRHEVMIMGLGTMLLCGAAVFFLFVICFRAIKIKGKPARNDVPEVDRAIS